MFRAEGWREEDYYGRVFQVEKAACMKWPREEGPAECWRMDAGAGFQPLYSAPLPQILVQHTIYIRGCFM